MPRMVKVGKWNVKKSTLEEYIKLHKLAQDYWYGRKTTPSGTIAERINEGSKYISKAGDLRRETSNMLGIKPDYFNNESDYEKFKLAFSIKTELMENGRE